MTATEAAGKGVASSALEHAEFLLDEALRETFPASDPIAVFVDARPAREDPAQRVAQ